MKKLEKLIQALPCKHCEDGVGRFEHSHVWYNGNSFCPRKLKLTPVKGLMIGRNQQVYISQWETRHAVCKKCGQLMGVNESMQEIETGDQVHRRCLTTWRPNKRKD
jgi:hypothetical protein